MIGNIKKLFTYVLIPALLLVFGTFMFYKNLLDNGFGLFNLLSYGKLEDIYVPRNNELLMGDKVYGKLTSNYPNLGIIAVRFFNNNRDSNDVITFRVKKESDLSWSYQANYNTDQFLPGELFPFGFPELKDSSGETFVFELESLAGSTSSGIIIDRNEPIFIGASFFSKQELLNDKQKLVRFLGQKVANILGEKDNLTSTVVYFLPTILYLFYLMSLGSSYQIPTMLTLVPIICDLLSLKNSYSILYFSVITLWIIFSYTYKFAYQISAFFSLSFIILVPLFNVLKLSTPSEKAGVWAYLFLCATFIKMFTSYSVPQKKYLKLENFFSRYQLIKINKDNWLLVVSLSVSLFWLTYHVFQKLVRSLMSVREGFLLFEQYYPQIDSPPGKYLFTAYILLATLGLLLLFCLKKKVFLRNKILILLLIYIYQALLNVAISKYTDFKYSPKILSLTPSITTEAWVDVTVNGKNFQDLPFVGKVTLAGEVQVENVHFWSNEKIVFRTNPANTKTGDVCIQTLSRGLSNCLLFEYNFNQKE